MRSVAAKQTRISYLVGNLVTFESKTYEKSTVCKHCGGGRAFAELAIKGACKQKFLFRTLNAIISSGDCRDCKFTLKLNINKENYKVCILKKKHKLLP